LLRAAFVIPTIEREKSPALCRAHRFQTWVYEVGCRLTSSARKALTAGCFGPAERDWQERPQRGSSGLHWRSLEHLSLVFPSERPEKYFPSTFVILGVFLEIQAAMMYLFAFYLSGLVWN
jgi:hypothetical protein